MSRTNFSRLYGSVYLRQERSDGRLGKICGAIVERRRRCGSDPERLFRHLSSTQMTLPSRRASSFRGSPDVNDNFQGVGLYDL